MVIMNEVVKPRAAKLFKFPVPAELIAVVGGTAASFLLQFEENYKVHLVGASMLHEFKMIFNFTHFIHNSSHWSSTTNYASGKIVMVGGS